MSSRALETGHVSGYSVQFVTSYDKNKQPFFCYLLVDDSLLPTFKKLVSKFAVNLAEFGVVLAKGPGHEPPESIKSQIRDKFPKADV